MNKKKLIKRSVTFFFWLLLFYCVWYMRFEYNKWLEEITPDYCRNLVMRDMMNQTLEGNFTWLNR